MSIAFCGIQRTRRSKYPEMRYLGIVKISSSLLRLCLFCYFVEEGQLSTSSHGGSVATWPAGRYGIPMPNTGCPGANGFHWDSGFIYQDLEDSNSLTFASDSFHLQGWVQKDVVRYFCIKNNDSNAVDNNRDQWPDGQYCIYKKGSICPGGLTEGWMLWDDENGVNGTNMNNNSGVLPEGTYKQDTKIIFCCQTSGKSESAIKLPVDKPFYLISYTGRCQEVWKTIHTAEYIQYDTENDNNHDNRTKLHPKGAELSEPRINYCYYQACRWKMTSLTGTFSSPGYPKWYKNNARCEWHINVPWNYNISLTFEKFELEDFTNCHDQTPSCVCDYVEVNETFTNGSSESKGKYCMGNMKPPKVIKSHGNHLIVIFYSDRGNGARGFKASYQAFQVVAPTNFGNSSQTTNTQATYAASTVPSSNHFTTTTSPRTTSKTSTARQGTKANTKTSSSVESGTSMTITTNTGPFSNTTINKKTTAAITTGASSTSVNTENKKTTVWTVTHASLITSPQGITENPSEVNGVETSGAGVNDGKNQPPRSRFPMIIVAITAALVLITGGLVGMLLRFWKKHQYKRRPMPDSLTVSFTSAQKSVGFSNVHSFLDEHSDSPSRPGDKVDQSRYVDVKLESRNMLCDSRVCRSASHREEHEQNIEETQNPLYAHSAEIVKETIGSPLYESLDAAVYKSHYSRTSRKVSVNNPIYERNQAIDRTGLNPNEFQMRS